MREFTPHQKHSILSHYCAGVRGAGFDALARRFAVKGGGSLIRSWYAAWDGTPASLQHKGGAGRPRILSRAEVSRHVRVPLLAANRAHVAAEQPSCEQPSTTQHCCPRSENAKRFDMIACCNGKQVFAPCIYTPKERSDVGVKGINTEMLVDYILSTLGQETWALDKPPLTLVVDRARIHNEERVMEAFRERGGHVTTLLKMPPMAAKRLSPLDNSLFHDWKEAVRKHGPLTLRNMEQVMADEWNRLPPAKIAAHYKHCGITGYSDVYADCPQPAEHQHDS